MMSFPISGTCALASCHCRECLYVAIRLEETGDEYRGRAIVVPPQATVSVVPEEKRCAVVGCADPVLPPRREYCSDACADRDRKRRSRRARRLATRADEETVKIVLRCVDPLTERQIMRQREWSDWDADSVWGVETKHCVAQSFRDGQKRGGLEYGR